jgi:hypothetical protein
LRSTKNVAFLHASVVRSWIATDVTDLHDSVMFPW